MTDIDTAGIRERCEEWWGCACVATARAAEECHALLDALEQEREKVEYVQAVHDEQQERLRRFADEIANDPKIAAELAEFEAMQDDPERQRAWLAEQEERDTTAGLKMLNRALKAQADAEKALEQEREEVKRLREVLWATVETDEDRQEWAHNRLEIARMARTALAPPGVSVRTVEESVGRPTRSGRAPGTGRDGRSPDEPTAVLTDAETQIEQLTAEVKRLREVLRLIRRVDEETDDGGAAVAAALGKIRRITDREPM